MFLGGSLIYRVLFGLTEATYLLENSRDGGYSRTFRDLQDNLNQRYSTLIRAE